MIRHTPSASAPLRPPRPVLRRLLQMLTLAATSVASTMLPFPAVAQAQIQAQAQAQWPTRPIKLIIPFPPGGAADQIGRYYAQQLGNALGQPVVVDNKPGAGTAIAAEAAAHAVPDGYTLSLATTGQLTILPNLNPKVRFDPIKDFIPVAVVASVPNVVAVHPKLGVRTLEELLARARSEEGKLTYSSCGSGTLCHLSGELLQSLTRTRLVHVPYKGSAPAVAAALGGEVDIAVDTLTILSPQIRAGKLQGLVLSSDRRSPLLPDVPDARESGLPDFAAAGWFGIVLPAGAPRPVIDRLAREIDTIAATSATAEHFTSRGITVERSTPDDFAKLIRADHARWAAIIRDAKIQAE